MPTLEPRLAGLTNTDIAGWCPRERSTDAVRSPLASRSTVTYGTMEPVCGEDGLRDGLVHPECRAEHSGTNVGHVGELEEALHRAVFAVRPVEDREDDVDAAEIAAVGSTPGAPGRTAVLDVAGGDRRRLFAAQHPPSVLVDPDGHRFVPVPIEVLEDRGCRDDRDLVLTRSSAIDHADAQFVVLREPMSPRNLVRR